MSSFLPEDDRDYLKDKGIDYQELNETLPSGEKRRAVLFPQFKVYGSLCAANGGELSVCEHCDLLVVVPIGYSTTKLDSFYTRPHLKHADGSDPVNATSDQDLFESKWQFWSRHLNDNEWRVGVDGLSTFLSYIKRELRVA